MAAGMVAKIRRKRGFAREEKGADS